MAKDSVDDSSDIVRNVVEDETAVAEVPALSASAAWYCHEGEADQARRHGRI